MSSPIYPLSRRRRCHCEPGPVAAVVCVALFGPPIALVIFTIVRALGWLIGLT